MDDDAGGFAVTTALLLSLGSTLVLAVLHLLAPRLRRLPGVTERAMVSLAGGLAASYVFLHLLPELARGHQELREVFGEERAPTPMTELGIFGVALAGFCVFYALERVAERHTSGHRGQTTPSPRPFWAHLSAFALYNAVITYTLESTYRTGLAYAALFTIAMGLHFVLTDRGLQMHYGALFDRCKPRLFLTGALLAGWVFSALFAPTGSLTVGVLIAFLAGSVMLNVFKEEIPAARKSSMPWFLTGLAVYAALLTGITALQS